MLAPPRIERVLVATDFSPGATAALERAAWLPLAADAVVHVVTVIPAGLPPPVEDERRRRAEEGIERAVARLHAVLEGRAERRVRATATVRHGVPFVEVIQHARAEKAELIVAGRRRRRSLRGIFSDSTGERLAMKGELPVLLVRDRPAGPYRRPFVALDLTDVSQRVLELALALTEGRTRALALVYAYDLPLEGSLVRDGSRHALAAYRRDCRVAAAAAAERFVASLAPPELRRELFLRAGDPRRIVPEELLRRRADLVVVGTHGRSGLAHVLLGSVAQAILRSAPCDVALTRPASFSFALP